MGEEENANLSKRVPAITGQYVHQIVGIAAAIAEPLHKIIICPPPELFRFGNETASGEAFALHKIAVGVRDRAFRQAPQRLMVIQQRWQRWLLLPQPLTPLTASEVQYAGEETARRKRLEYVEHLRSVFLVLQKFAEMPKSL